jgi:hypothetical protein
MLEIMRKNLLKLGAVASALFLGGYSVANAVPTLTISDGITTITVLDSTPATGLVVWSGTIGGWTLNLDTGDTKPDSGTAEIPDMTLGFQTLSPTAGGTLTITWSDAGFGPSTGDFNASITGNSTPRGGGSATTSVGFTTYYNTGNTIPAGPVGGTLLTTINSLPGSELAYVSPLLLGGDYSLTEVVTITSSSSRQGVETTGHAYLVAVPDAGSTLILLGTAMSMLGVFSRSRSKRQKA